MGIHIIKRSDNYIHFLFKNHWCEAKLSSQSDKEFDLPYLSVQRSNRWEGGDSTIFLIEKSQVQIDVTQPPFIDELKQALINYVDSHHIKEIISLPKQESLISILS